MEITIQPQAQWHAEPGTTINVRDKWLSMLNSQQHNKTLWYIVSLVTQSVLFLPVPAAMIYYFNAPLLLLPITLGLFFASIIAAMGGAGVRVIMFLFALSTITHIIMVSVYSL